MNRITGKGAPTRKTAGAIGDIYTDVKTGQKYVCTFAYKSGTDKEFDCEWKKRVDGKNFEIKKEEKPDIPVEVAEESLKKPEVSEIPKRRDYSSYSKKNR